MINTRAIAILAVNNYLKTNYIDLEIEAKYGIVLDVIEENYKNYTSATSGISSINSISQGSQSISFNNLQNSLITEEVKLLLPKPMNFQTW